MLKTCSEALPSTGRLVTAATWQRNFAYSHPEYKKDSVMTAGMTYDMVKAIDRVEKGEQPAPELLGNDYKAPCDVDLPVP